MDFKYKIEKKRSAFGDKEIKFYASAVRSGNIGTSQMANLISERCTLTQVDVKATLFALAQVMREYLSKGYYVNLDEIGRFSISSTSDGYSSESEIRPSVVKAKRICFKADKSLKKILPGIKFKKA